MMRVRLTTRRVTGSGYVNRPGDIIEVAEPEGLALIRDLSATPVSGGDEPPETATLPAATTERRKRGRPRNN